MVKRLVLAGSVLLIVLASTSVVLAQGVAAPAFASCTQRHKTMSGSYLLSPADPQSPRIYYEVKYQVNSNCTITNVQDRTRGSVLPDEPMKWLKTCTNGASNCISRSINIPLSGAWTAWKSAPSTNVGKEYRHYTQAYGGNWVAYGYTYFAK